MFFQTKIKIIQRGSFKKNEMTISASGICFIDIKIKDVNINKSTIIIGSNIEKKYSEFSSSILVVFLSNNVFRVIFDEKKTSEVIDFFRWEVIEFFN